MTCVLSQSLYVPEIFSPKRGTAPLLWHAYYPRVCMSQKCVLQKEVLYPYRGTRTIPEFVCPRKVFVKKKYCTPIVARVLSQNLYVPERFSSKRGTVSLSWHAHYPRIFVCPRNVFAKRGAAPLSWHTYYLRIFIPRNSFAKKRYHTPFVARVASPCYCPCTGV